ncbi:MAG: HI0074 family nucleotidyltransferase substrate-binding subunit [bacterium]|nr:HI0074 family nucleotidyltransferase substrate-binding subunit [bacterium]
MEGKSINRYRSFCRSLDNLADAKGRDMTDKFILCGTVQMYNLSFDLAWKVMKDIITEYHGALEYPTGSPRETLRMAGSVGLIADDTWLEMLKVRNNLAHDYDGELACKYFEKITTTFDTLLEGFRDQAAIYYQSKEDKL